MTPQVPVEWNPHLIVTGEIGHSRDKSCIHLRRPHQRDATIAGSFPRSVPQLCPSQSRRKHAHPLGGRSKTVHGLSDRQMCIEVMATWMATPVGKGGERGGGYRTAA